jgi:hypothetical protein
MLHWTAFVRSTFIAEAHWIGGTKSFRPIKDKKYKGTFLQIEFVLIAYPIKECKLLTPLNLCVVPLIV